MRSDDSPRVISDEYSEYMKRWRRKNKERLRQARQDPERKRRRRILALREYARKCGYELVEDVDFDVVYERDHGTCQICNEPVDLGIPKRAGEPMSATIDHTEPIHSYDTVRLAHRICNERRL